MKQDPSDEALLRDSLQDPEAFSGLVGRYERRAYGLIRRLCGGHADAEDLYQNAWSRAFAFRLAFKGESRFSTWFYAICLNVVRDWKLSLVRRPPMEVLDEERHGGSFWPWNQDRAESRLELQKSLESLDDEAREMIVLRYFEDLDDAGVAEVLGVPRARVRVKIHRALVKLRQGASHGDR